MRNILLHCLYLVFTGPGALLRVLLFGVLAAATIVLAKPARADTRIITNTNDSGVGSLRQAVLDAAPGDTVVFDSSVFSVPHTIILTTGQIEINKPLIIDGAAGSVFTPKISGNGASRIFMVTTGVNVVLNQLRIVDGHGSGVTLDGGGIINSGTLTVANSMISGNSALSTRPSFSGGGGGIVNWGTLNITNSTISGNNALDGGAIANSGVLNVANSVISDNYAAAAGGGIANFDILNVINSTIATNRIVSVFSSIINAGGGIYNSGALSMTNCTISSNSIEGYGGGIHNTGILSITNCTVSGNSAGDGGGIGNGFIGITGTLKVSNSTIVSNSAVSDGGGIANFYGTTTLRNTVVASSPSGGNCYGSVTDDGHNLDSSNTCNFSVTLSSLINTNPLLGPLADNGGSTLTHALLSGSPAIDAGDDADCPSTDQRGVPRPLGAHCDIGAFEAFNKLVFLPIVQR